MTSRFWQYDTQKKVNKNTFNTRIFFRHILKVMSCRGQGHRYKIAPKQ